MKTKKQILALGLVMTFNACDTVTIPNTFTIESNSTGETTTAVVNRDGAGNIVIKPVTNTLENKEDVKTGGSEANANINSSKDDTNVIVKTTTDVGDVNISHNNEDTKTDTNIIVKEDVTVNSTSEKPNSIENVSNIIGSRSIQATDLSKGTRYASPNGDGSGSSEDDPSNIVEAFENLEAGDTLFLRGGTYNLKKGLELIGVKGTKENPIIIESYPNEKAILDGGETLSHIKENEIFVRDGIKIASSSEYIHIRNIEIKNMGGGGIYIEFSSHNTIKGCTIHHNYYGGINLYGGSDGQSKPYVPYIYGYNTIQDNTIYANSDEGLGTMAKKLKRGIYGYANGNNADGISISSGKFNKIIHNTVYSNSDDGIDTWRSNDTYIAYNTVYDNGKRNKNGEGDGNGIKTGGNLDKNVDNGARAVVEFNISYANKMNGFDYNFGKNVIMRYNTSYNNGNNGFRTGGDALASYNIAHENKYNSNLKGKNENNSWQINGSVSFISIDSESKDFLKPLEGSDFETMGVYGKSANQGGNE